MKVRVVFGIAVLAIAVLVIVHVAAAPATPAGEYSQHFAALSDLSVAVAEAMPPSEYDFRPDPPSMTFGEVMVHIGKTNYMFCAGLKDTPTPKVPVGQGKEEVVKFLKSSFDYCSGVISGLTAEQLSAPHNSPDGRMPGRDILLVMYIHVAHHRGQAEIYLRDKGIEPPQYRI